MSILNRVSIGASVRMQAKEVDDMAGSGEPRVWSDNGVHFYVGYGVVGLVQSVTPETLPASIEEAKRKRADLAELARTDPKTLFEFTRMA